MIFSHESPEYRDNVRNKNHGAFYYSEEIVKYFIPTIKTNRNWVTVGYDGKCFDRFRGRVIRKSLGLAKAEPGDGQRSGAGERAFQKISAGYFFHTVTS